MALTGKGSTRQTTLPEKGPKLLKKEKKKGALQSILSAAREGGAQLYRLTHTDEAKAAKKVLTSPGEVISTGLRETSKAAGKAGDYLQDIGRQAEEAKIPVVSQAGSITRAAGTLVSGPEQTRQNVLRIGDEVKRGKITVADGILEAGSSAGLQGITLLAAPFLQAINSGLNITGLDEPLEKGIEGGTNFLTNVTKEAFNLSEEKARSRVNSALNVLRGFTMYKGGKISNRGGAGNFVKGSTIISSPDIALSALALAAKEEDLPMPTPEKLEGITANVATALIPAPGQKIRAPKGTKAPTKPKTAGPKVDLKKTLDEPTLPKELQVKPKESLKQEQAIAQAVTKPKITKTNKKRISNDLQTLAGLQDVKAMEANIRDGIMTKAQALSEKQNLINNLIRDGILVKGDIDTKGQSYQFTDLARTEFNIGGKNSSLPFLKEGVHMPVDAPVVKAETPEAPKKTPKLQDTIIVKENQKQVSNALKTLDSKNISTVAKKISKQLGVEIAKVQTLLKGYVEKYGPRIKNAIAEIMDDLADKLGVRSKLLGGEGAFKAPVSKLQQAKNMAEAGKNVDQIWKETGWEKGKDGKWRFEIDDDTAKIKRKQIGEVETVGDVLDHPALFENYPEIKNIKLEYRDLPGIKGMYNPIDNKIVISDKLGLKTEKIRTPEERTQAQKDRLTPYWLKGQPTPKKIKEGFERKTEGFKEDKAGLPDWAIKAEIDGSKADLPDWLKGDTETIKDISKGEEAFFTSDNQKSTILHEIQHAIQQAEDFASGGNPKSLAKGDIQTLQKAVNKIKSRLKTTDSEGLRQTLQEIEKNIQLYKKDASSIYRKLAGEVEARNVQTRLEEGQKSIKRPGLTEDTPREDQIIVKDGDISLQKIIDGADDADSTPKTETGLQKKTPGELTTQRDIVKVDEPTPGRVDAEGEPTRAKVFRKDKPQFIDYAGKEEFEGLTPRLNIAAKRFQKKGKPGVKGRLQDALKGGANIILDAGKTIKDLALSTVGGFLDSVVTTDTQGNKHTLGDLMGGVKGKVTGVKDKVRKALYIQQMNDFLSKNTNAIEEGFNYIKSKNLKELIPGDNIESRMRRFFIEKAQNANELYARNLGVKQNFANRVSVLAQYVGGEIAARIRKAKRDQSQAIKDADYTDDVKAKLLDEIKLSDEEITQIQNEVISTMPGGTRDFLNEYFNLYGQFKEDTLIKRGFKDIGAEMVEKGLLDESSYKEDYVHGYVPDEILRQYIKISGNDLGFTKQQISAFLKEGVPLTPEQRSSILKQSNDIWYLHSQDPLSIVHSYTNEAGELILHKMVDDLIDSVSERNPEVANYLRGAKDQNSKIYNDIREIARPKSLGVRALDKYLNASAYGLYVLNPTLIAQNAFTSAVYGLGKSISNLITGKGSYGADVFTVKNRNPTAEYLFNKGLLAHRDIDSNIGFRGDATAGEKIKRNTKKYVWEQPMQKSTSLGVKTIQVITANAFMKKFVGDDIRQGETIVDAYKRKLDTLSPEEQLKAETELYRQVTSIENPTNLNRATNALFDIKLFGMVTAWARSNSSYIISKTMDTIDTIHNNIMTAAKKKGYTKIKDGQSVDNMTTVGTKLVLAYTAAKVLGELLYDEDDDRQDEIKKRLNAKSFKDNMQYFLTHSTGLAGLNIGGRNLGYLTDLGIQVMDAYENGDKETAGKALNQFVDRWFSGIKKTKDIIKGDEAQFTKSGEFKYQDEYGDETFGDLVGRVMGMSKPAAEYSQTYDRLVELENEIKSKSDQYNNFSIMFDNLKRAVDIERILPVGSSSMQNVKYRIKVDRMNRNIKDLALQKVGFDEWMDGVYEGIEEVGQARDMVEGKLSEQFVKNAQSNMKEVGKLQHVVREINAMKGVQLYPNDFGRTLESLKGTHPKLYNKFMKQLYNTISSEGITPEIRESNSKFVDGVIASDLGGEMLSTNISSLVRRVAGLDEDLKREQGQIVDDYEKLRSLEKVIGTLENAPMLQEQIFSSLSELVNTSITKDNAQQIFDAIKEFPIIADLYRKAAQLRGAILIDETEEPEIPEEPTIEEPKKGNLAEIINNQTDVGIPKTSLETEKLIDLIDLETEPVPEPRLEKVNLQTLLDKVL